MNNNKKLYVVLAIVAALAIIIWIVSMTATPDVTPAPADSSTGASVSITSVSDSGNLAAAGAVFAGKTITWTVAGYPADAGININLLRKTSDSPIAFELVRQLAENTPNDGLESWEPTAEDTGELYIEVTCSTAFAYADGCSVTSAPIKVQ